MKILIVGSGITGLTLAEILSRDKSRQILILEKRPHIGGNCYDEFIKYDRENNFYIQPYGPHIFHTEYEKVWNYIKNFSEFNLYKHKVKAYIDGKLINLPISLESLKQYFDNYSEKIIKKLFKKFNFGTKINFLELKRFKDKEIKMLYYFIYEKIFKNYTFKQWGKDISKLEIDLSKRMPLILDFGIDFFRDKYQGIPKDGYISMFENMINKSNIRLELEVKFNKDFIKNFDYVFYTGRIDEFFDFKYGQLEYIKINSERQILNQKYFQEVAVINYPNNYNFTRITEFRHLIDLNSKKTIIYKEFPNKNEGFDSYPLLDKKNLNKYELYKKDALSLKNIYFLGRLAEFKYLNMDECILNVLNFFENFGIKI